jgi:hypothetical protein
LVRTLGLSALSLRAGLSALPLRVGPLSHCGSVCPLSHCGSVLGEGTGRTRDLRTPVRVRAQTDLDLWSRGRCLLISYPLAVGDPQRGAVYRAAQLSTQGSVRSLLRVGPLSTAGRSVRSLTAGLSVRSLTAGWSGAPRSLPGWWVSLGRPRIDFGPLIYKQE